MARKDDFDWLDDPFDEKKAAKDEMRAATSGGTKLALGCGCLIAVVGIVVLDRKSTRLNSSHCLLSRMPSSA